MMSNTPRKRQSRRPSLPCSFFVVQFNGNNSHYHHGGDIFCTEFGGTNIIRNNTRRIVSHGKHTLLTAMNITIMIMMLFMTVVDGFSSSSSGGRFLSASPLVNVRSTASKALGELTMVPSLKEEAVLIRQAAGIISSSYNHHHGSNNRGGGSVGRITTTSLYLFTTDDDDNNSQEDQDYSSSNDEELNEDSLKALQLIQQWLLLHLPSLSNDDLKLYSMQLFEDGFDSVERLEGVNNGGAGSRLEDLYFMKKGHRRVLMQKIGKVREMKGNAKNRLRLFEEEEEEEKEDEMVMMMMDGEESGEYDGVGIESSSSSSSEGDKYKPTIVIWKGD